MSYRLTLPALTLLVSTLMSACASGGGAPPLVGAEAEALFAELTGVWVLDEFGSSPQIATPTRTEVTRFTINKSGGRGYISEVTGKPAKPGLPEATYEVLRLRPEILTLQVDSWQLVYTPLGGRSLTVPMNGKWTARTDGKWGVRARVVWDQDDLGLEHQVGLKGWVTEYLEVVAGRLRMERALYGDWGSSPVMRAMRGDQESSALLVLMFDREEDGG